MVLIKSGGGQGLLYGIKKFWKREKGQAWPIDIMSGGKSNFWKKPPRQKSGGRGVAVVRTERLVPCESISRLPRSSFLLASPSHRVFSKRRGKKHRRSDVSSRFSAGSRPHATAKFPQRFLGRPLQ
jgi:hypothetical protein